MLSEDKAIVKSIVHLKDLRLRDKALVLLYAFRGQTASVSSLVELAIDVGVRKFNAKNLSGFLFQNSGLAILVRGGWELTDEGVAAIEKWLPEEVRSKVVTKTTAKLRKKLSDIKDSITRKFVEEAIVCFENECFRAAAVLSWVGAVSILQNWTLNNKLKDFNGEGVKRYGGKWKDIAGKDDFSRLQEKEFLDLLKASSVLGKSQHHALEERLEFRNGCGHPNTMEIGENMVAAHIESLILNVFSKY